MSQKKIAEKEYLCVLEEFQNFTESIGQPYRASAISAFRMWMNARGRCPRLGNASIAGVAVRAAIKSSLSRPHRMLLVLLHVSELTIHEAAEVLELPISRVLEMQVEIYQLVATLHGGRND